MASNPYVNKVVFGNQTVMDISDTDAEEADVVEGKTFYKKNGARAAGTASYYSPNDTASTDIADDDLVPFYDDSASAKKNTLWSNIKLKLKDYFYDLFDDFPKETSSNPVTSSGIYKSVQGSDVVVEKTVGFVNKNLFHIDSSIVDATDNGISFYITRNSDGEVTRISVNGSISDPTQEAVLDLGQIDVNVGTFILSGGLSEDLFLRATRVSGGGIEAVEDEGDGVEFTNSVMDGMFNRAYLVVKADFHYMSVFPMIRNAEVGSSRFYPYSTEETVKEQLNDLYDKIGYQITRSGVTASENGTVRIPASGTDSRISTANTCLVIPIAQTKSDGTSYKIKSCVVSSGYATITVAEAISNIEIGVLVINS